MTDAKKSGRKSSRSKSTKGKAASPPIKQRKIATPEEFDRLVDSYITMCRAAKPYPEPITLTGMILALGLTSKEGFYHYKTYPGFEESVNRARLFVECAYETKLHGPNAAGAIFALKNFAWMDIPPEQLEKFRLEIEKLKREQLGGSDSVAKALSDLADKLPA